MSIGTYSSGTSSQTSHVIISCSRVEDTGSGSGQPWSRYRAMTSRAMARTSALSSSVMYPWTSLRKSPAGFR